MGQPSFKAICGNTIPISKMLFQSSPQAFAQTQSPGFCHHIICDPPQATLSDIQALYRLIPLAFNSLKTRGFLIFFFPVNHLERLTKAAENLGFLVQPWPLIWNKTDYNRHEALLPSTSFPPSYETLLVCRKAETLLFRSSLQSVFSVSGKIPRERFQSPRAKPISLWRWLLASIAKPGQIIWDPFAHTGSSIVACIDARMKPLACEADHLAFAKLLASVQSHFLHRLGPTITFT